jgi:hypothetical protein
MFTVNKLIQISLHKKLKSATYYLPNYTFSFSSFLCTNKELQNCVLGKSDCFTIGAFTVVKRKGNRAEIYYFWAVTLLLGCAKEWMPIDCLVVYVNTFSIKSPFLNCLKRDRGIEWVSK